MILHQDDVFVPRWVANRIPHMRDEKGEVLPFPAPCVGIAVLDARGAVLGGVVYHNFYPHLRSIEMSAAAATKRWLTRDVLRHIFEYPFEQLRVQRVTMITGRKNDAARTLLRNLGFRQEGCVRRGLRNQDAIIYGMLASEWKRSKFSQERGAALAA